MKMKFTLGIVLATTILAGTAQSAKAAPRPNVLYLYADDLGWGDCRANTGSETPTKTPTIDSLIDSGINFRQAYGCMVCSPARSTQQTGFHQGHTWTDRNDTDSLKKAIRADDLTIGDRLNAAGYRTGYYGKWGYGASSTLVDPVIQNQQTLPINHGYTDMLAELHHVRAHTYFQPSLWFNNIDTLGTNTVLKYNANDGGAHTEYADDLYAADAEAFIRTHAQTPQPFFCEIAFQVPHTPLGDVAEMPGWFDDYAGTDATNWPAAAQEYAAMVNRQDHHIANLLAALDDPNGDGNTNDSVRANTLIVFASDNGGQGGTPYTFFHTNGNLDGTKGSVKEGGIRVPTAFIWQGVIAPGQSTDHITCVSDMLPTLCELAGILPPVGIDGVSIAPLLTGQGQQRVRPWYTHESGNSWSLIRPDGIKLRNTGALYHIVDGSNTNYEANNLLANSSDPMFSTYQQWAADMQAIAIAERVTEPYGFANTYHHWTGSDGGNMSEAANWSDYLYENAGTTYISETGAPRERWIATLANTGATDQTAVLDTDINTLGIEVAGNAATGAKQTLSLVPGNRLDGRNEIRLSPLANVELNGGILASTRWVDLLEGATITGPGTIDAILYNAGTLDVTTNMLDGTTYTTNIIPGSGGDITIAIDSAANSTARGTSDQGTFSTILADLIADNSAPPGTLAHTITGLTLDETGGANDSIRIEFTVTTGGNQNIQTSGTTQNGWLSPGSTTLNSNGDWIQLSPSLVRVDLNGGTGNGFGSFAGFTQVQLGSWAADHIATVNGILFEKPSAGAGYLTLPNDPNLKALFDTAANTGTAKDCVGSWRPEGWSFQISTSGDPIPAVTNITTNVVSSAGVVVSKDYHQSAIAILDVPVFGATTSLVVTGTANLDGRLECSLPAGFTAANGDRFTIISAGSVNGFFSNADGMIEKDGHHFRIHYSADKVELEKVAVTAMGTPQWWLDLHGLASDLTDTDGDGFKEWEEYIAGTLPNNSSSALTLDPMVAPEETGYIVRWQSASNRIYHLQGSTNLIEGFMSLVNNIPATPPENTYTDNTESETAFYRVQSERN